MIYLSNFRPNGNKHKNVLIAIFQDCYELSQRFFKSSAESNLNRFFIFSNKKCFVRFLTEEIKTCTVDVCRKSVFNLKYSQHLITVVFNSANQWTGF